MPMRKGKVFIDSNILIHATQYQLADVFLWIDQLYEEIFIYKVVLDELLETAVRSKVLAYIEKGKWCLFDPDDEEALSEEMYIIYERHVGDIKHAFRQLDKKKIQQGRQLKGTNDLGEIHCLAAAMLLSASIICSNDYDIKEVIDDATLVISVDEMADDVLIQQDTLLLFCYYVIYFHIEEISKVRKLLKTFQPRRLAELDKMIKNK